MGTETINYTAIRNFLHTLPAFERFSTRHLEIFASQLTIEDLHEGQVMHAVGVQGRGMYIIMEGSTSVSRLNPNDGLLEPVNEAREGECVCMLSLVEEMPATRTYIAHSRTRVAVLTRERYMALFLLAPPIAHQLQYMLAVKLACALQERNASLRSHIAQQKKPSLIERLLG